MDTSDRADRTLRASTAIVLGATMVGLLVWYGSVAGGRAVVGVLLDVLRFPAALFAGGLASAPLSPTTIVADGVALVAPTSSGPLPDLRTAWTDSYVYDVSAIAAAWVVLRFWRRWRFDPSAGVVPRSRGEEDDA